MIAPALRIASVGLLGLTGLLGSCKPSPPTVTDASVDAAPALDSSVAVKPDAAPDPVETAARGKVLYEKYCGFCHGESGQGYKADQAPALASDDLLALASDEFLVEAIAKGRPGTTMSAWSVARGGPLGYADAAAIVAYVRTWQKRPAEPLDARPMDGNAAAAKATYATLCASCHGAKGRNGKYNSLANAELLSAASDAFLATTIERGRAGTPMAAFGAKLSRTQVEDLVALLRSWKVPPEELPELPPKAGQLGAVVVNPKGPQPDLEEKASFVKVDLVKRELDRGASMILIDARPPADYARMHIVGAISVPFYQVADYAKQIPRDRYILTYCACPHAESGQVRDALRALGYPRVAVIDDGLLVWRDRGYGVRGGARP
ncbi:hypothetical protein BH11MYX4_BH11MYX4_42770 [soil metagenome]